MSQWGGGGVEGLGLLFFQSIGNMSGCSTFSGGSTNFGFSKRYGGKDPETHLKDTPAPKKTPKNTDFKIPKKRQVPPLLQFGVDVHGYRVAVGDKGKSK